MTKDEMAITIFHSYIGDKPYSECRNLSVDMDEIYDRMCETFSDVTTAQNLRLMADALDLIESEFDHMVDEHFRGEQEEKEQRRWENANRGEI